MYNRQQATAHIASAHALAATSTTKPGRVTFAQNPRPSAPPKQRRRPALFGTTTAERPAKKSRTQRHVSLSTYDKRHGTHHTESHGTCLPLMFSRSYRRSHCQPNPETPPWPHYNSIYHVPTDASVWKQTIPTPSQLLTNGFGQPDKDHSATQGACFETSVVIFLKFGSNYLSIQDLQTFLVQHPLI